MTGADNVFAGLVPELYETDVAAAAVARRFGAPSVDGKIQAHITIVER